MFFKVTVEIILLYGSETWTTTAKMNYEIDGLTLNFSETS